MPKLKCVKNVLGKNHKCVAIERDYATFQDNELIEFEKSDK